MIAPLAIIWTPRRYLLPVIAGVIAASIVYRFNLALQGKHALTYLPTLLGNADALAMGIGAAVLSREIRPNRIVDRLLEIAPLACLGSIIVASAFIPEDMPIALFMRPVIALASAAFILRIAMNAQVSTWLKAPFLCTTGHNSYSIYLVHMPIAGIVHGLITGLHPDIGSASQNFATALSFPATMLVALALTKAVEDPATRLGRSFRWNSPPSRPAKPVLDAAPQPQTPSAAQAGTA
jgi:peptidoglycan/LPS O-acetylase OafA/YrhL